MAGKLEPEASQPGLLIRLLRATSVAIVTGLLLVPREALACPVCFGSATGPIARGMNLAILVLLGVTGGVLAAFAWFFLSLLRRARRGGVA